MRVLHVIRGLTNSSGTTHIVLPLSEEQARQGCKVSVFFVEKGDEPALRPDAALVESRCFALSAPMPNPGVSLPFARGMRQSIADFDFVHIHAIWNFPTYYAMRAAWKAKIPYMVAPQGSFETWALGQNYWGKKLYGLFAEMPLLRRADYLQALTAKEAEQFRQAGIDAPSVIIPNGIDEGFYPETAPRLSERLGLPPESKTLLYLSRLHPKKGLEILLGAFAGVVSAHSNVTLVIAGHDAGTGYIKTLERQIGGLGLIEKCRLIGEVAGRNKYEILKGADAFVLSSHSEGLPVAVLEAMGAGLPVVISHGCNIPEVEQYQAGYVVDAKGDRLAEALNKLFCDWGKARQMGENGRRLVRDKFTWKSIARQTIRIYGESCAQARVPPLC